MDRNIELNITNLNESINELMSVLETSDCVYASSDSGYHMSASKSPNCPAYVSLFNPANEEVWEFETHDVDVIPIIILGFNAKYYITSIGYRPL